MAVGRAECMATGFKVNIVILVRPTMIDILSLCSNARSDEIEQYEALIGPWNMDDAASAFFTSDGVKFALVNDDDIAVCVGGWDHVIPGVWQSWMVGTDDYWQKYWRSITKYTLRVMEGLFNDGARRLQTGALASRTRACEWYTRGLKMKPEGICRGFGLNGEDMATFARVKENF